MARDASRRSSLAGSSHVPSPRENGDEASAQERPQSDDKAPTTQSTSSADDSVNVLELNAPHARAAESQPMTASNSTSSDPSLKDAASSGTGPAVPYGTRSRNRTGTSRPNYAEDKEPDAEFEIAPNSKDINGRKPGRATEPGSTADTGRPTSTTRKAAGTEPDLALPVQSHYKEPIPGTSTFSANPAATGTSSSSRKRKATAQPATLQPSTQGLQLTPQAVTRRASMAAQVAAGFRDSNMLTFENCAGRLKGKRLVADDGTILEVNGRFAQLLDSSVL